MTSDRTESMTTTGYLRAQYGREGKLEVRRSVWRDPAHGPGPAEVAARAILAEHPESVLEVGCGTGAFAERLTGELPRAAVIAVDQSQRFADLTAGRGVVARQADVQDLPFEDGQFDVVAAMWMLYHVADLDRGLAEVRRVIRPGGLLVAVTNGDEHLADLLVEAGGSRLVTQFSSENGEVVLRRHFSDVRAQHQATRAVFDDHAEAVGYLASFDHTLAAQLPPFEGAREYAGATTVFLAR